MYRPLLEYLIQLHVPSLTRVFNTATCTVLEYRVFNLDNRVCNTATYTVLDYRVFNTATCTVLEYRVFNTATCTVLD